MTIIVFLVDTSASMNQRTYLGTSLLDVAKWAVENFMKVIKIICGSLYVEESFVIILVTFFIGFIQIRSRDPASRLDRYMLLTFEDPPANIKVRLFPSDGSWFTNQVRTGDLRVLRHVLVVPKGWNTGVIHLMAAILGAHILRLHLRHIACLQARGRWEGYMNIHEQNY